MFGSWTSPSAPPGPFPRGLTLLKSKHLCCPKIGMWGVYPEAMNGLQCWQIVLRFNFGWPYLEKESLWRPNLKEHFEIRPSGDFSPNTLTQNEIWAQSANIAGHCLWIDTQHARVMLIFEFMIFHIGTTCFWVTLCMLILKLLLFSRLDLF